MTQYEDLQVALDRIAALELRLEAAEAALAYHTAVHAAQNATTLIADMVRRNIQQATR